MVSTTKSSLLALTLRLLRLDELIITDIIRTFLLLIIVGRWLRSFIGKLNTKVSDNRYQLRAPTHIICIFDIRRRTPSQLFGSFAQVLSFMERYRMVARVVSEEQA